MATTTTVELNRRSLVSQRLPLAHGHIGTSSFGSVAPKAEPMIEKIGRREVSPHAYIVKSRDIFSSVGIEASGDSEFAVSSCIAKYDAAVPVESGRVTEAEIPFWLRRIAKTTKDEGTVVDRAMWLSDKSVVGAVPVSKRDRKHAREIVYSLGMAAHYSESFDGIASISSFIRRFKGKASVAKLIAWQLAQVASYYGSSDMIGRSVAELERTDAQGALSMLTRLTYLGSVTGNSREAATEALSIMSRVRPETAAEFLNYFVGLALIHSDLSEVKGQYAEKARRAAVYAGLKELDFNIKAPDMSAEWADFADRTAKDILRFAAQRQGADPQEKQKRALELLSLSSPLIEKA